MDKEQYNQLVRLGMDAGLLGGAVQDMPRFERYRLLKELEASGCRNFVKSLWYCYNTQTLIMNEKGEYIP